ncbi:uncharacterized protein N7459_003556 [Penicillium hispanicum]|uniref:uncharacterized protein n=1 Tax=Penicillium hispanicum TaxID=1080232 RepID=UPI00254215B2|nr:uncharacterized protein N7459_003556 [Penicillium hispanicum]KAJ5587791.1 hypothetical protein N7459_003556 [Penicillium hispanicum]
MSSISEMPTFSYAQAAKGVPGTPVPSKPASIEPEVSEPKPEEKANDVTTEPVTTTAETETPSETEKAAPSVSKEAEFTTVTSKHAARSKAAHTRTSSPSVRSTTHAKEGEASNTPNGNAEPSSEKKTQTDTKAEKLENDAEGSKEKSGNAEKSAPPKELKAAPLPTVNIWQQRKEAQEAKAKTTPAVTTGKTTPGKTSEDSQQDTSKTGAKKKGADGASEGTKDRKKTEGGKARDDALPPVGDASLWPTPQVALGEEKKKAQEKTDKPEKTEKSPVSRSHGKEKWMPVNYVPTAVFNTPLPSSGRGGRRAARGGRDGGRGGAHGAAAATAEKVAPGQAAQGPAVKQASGERGRNEAGTGRAASLPAQSRRSDSADVANADGRKAQAGDRGRAPRITEDAVASNGKQANGGENFARAQRDSKQFSKHSGNPKAAQLAVDSQAAARANDRRIESGSKSADLTRESNGFPDFNRERGDSRAERGGRGPNRGRGPYASFGGQNPQFGNMPNNFVPKQFGFNERQRSHGLPNGSQQSNRMPLRSPSLPASGNIAIPYQQYMEPFSVVTMLSMQLEYYFSVDNMCKDMFLRRQMDSQGFVPLGVIASFKRVKSLTEDFELIRHVSRNLRNLEYQTGEDGVDRVRPRERWAQWILPVDQRDPAAQHESAPPAKQSAKNDENAPFNHHADGAPNGSINPASRQFIPNGTGSRNPRTPLSSTAPEFMPSTQNEIANVGHPTDFAFLPKTGPELADPFHNFYPPWNDTFIDGLNSARGLDSQSTTPVPSSSETADQSSGFDAGSNKRGPAAFVARPTDRPSFKKQYPPSMARGWDRGPSSHQKSAHVNQSSELTSNRDSWGRQAWANSTTGPRVAGLPYRSWSQYLARNFDLQMYNEFRHQALDDLFTRHVDYGFNALLDFYRSCLLSYHLLPDEVIEDMVSLSREPSFNAHRAIHDLLQWTMRSGSMNYRNREKAGKFFNREYGKPRKGGRNSLR